MEGMSIGKSPDGRRWVVQLDVDRQLTEAEFFVVLLQSISRALQETASRLPQAEKPTEERTPAEEVKKFLEDLRNRGPLA